MKTDSSVDYSADFEKALVKVGSSHLYSSFVTFCVQIGQLHETQWVFEKCLKTVK